MPFPNYEETRYLYINVYQIVYDMTDRADANNEREKFQYLYALLVKIRKELWATNASKTRAMKN
jgi:hypothetical protein